MKLIILTNGEEVKVSDSDYPELKKHKWFKNKLGYSVANVDGNPVFMHRFILKDQLGKGLLVDHIDGDGLNNTRENLRVCTKTQNQQNQKPRHVRRSPFKGVGYMKRDWKFRARIVVNKKDIELGKFKCEICAALAYDEAAKKYHGEFAWLNSEHFEITEETHFMCMEK